MRRIVEAVKNDDPLLICPRLTRDDEDGKAMLADLEPGKEIKSRVDPPVQLWASAGEISRCTLEIDESRKAVYLEDGDLALAAGLQIAQVQSVGFAYILAVEDTL